MNQLPRGLQKLKLLHVERPDFGQSCQAILEHSEIDSEGETMATSSTPSNTRVENYLDRKIFIGNISKQVKPARLKKFLSKFGEVTRVHIVLDYKNRTSKGIAFATFAKAEFASKAKMALPQDLHLDGRNMRVSAAEDRRKYKLRSKKSELQKDVSSGLTSSKNIADPSPINILTDDSLWLILSYLNIKELLDAENVCKRWKAIACSIWATKHSLNLKKVFTSILDGQILTDDIFEKLMLRCTNLKTLDLIGVTHCLTFRTSEILVELCHKLETLKIENLDIDKKRLMSLSENCRNLKVLCVKRCCHIEDKGLRYLLKNSQSLEYFEINDNLRFTGQCLEKISPHLKVLIVSSCSRFRACEKISIKCKNLQILKLCNTAHFLTNKELEDICKNCICIEEFELTKASTMGLSSDGLLHLANLNNLKCLNLSDLRTQVTDEVIIAICKKCQALSTLDVSKCVELTDRGLQYLKLLPYLRHLNLNFVSALTSIPLKDIATRGQLETLSLISCDIEEISGPVQVLTLCHKMVQLNLADNPLITTEMIEECIEAVKTRQETHTLTIGCGGCSASFEELCELTLPSYVDLNWHSYSNDYDFYDEIDMYSDLSDDDDDGDGDYEDDEYDCDDPYDESDLDVWGGEDEDNYFPCG